MIFIAFILLFPLQLYNTEPWYEWYGTESIFYLAAHPECIHLLKNALDNGANPNLYYREMGFNSMNAAICTNNIEGVKLLLKYGARINKIKYSPLAMAIFNDEKNSHKEIISLLLQKGADINSCEENPLTFTKPDAQCTINKFILFGIDPYLKNKYGITAIKCLQAYERLKAIEYIRKRSKKLFEMLTILLHKGTVVGGIKLPLDMAKLIASYCYPQEENFMRN